MRLWIAEVDEHAVAQVLGDVPVEASDLLVDHLVVGAQDSLISSGSRRALSSVESTFTPSSSDTIGTVDEGPWQPGQHEPAAQVNATSGSTLRPFLLSSSRV
jgi:hypothetical protein